MAGKVLNFKACSPLKQRGGLTGNYHAFCLYSQFSIPSGILLGSRIRRYFSEIKQKSKLRHCHFNY